jgi:glucose-1-phosphate adenylyltransferase
VYKMDYKPLIDQHKESNADITLAVHSVSPHDTRRYGIVSAGSDGRVDSFEEKPRRANSNLASMGVYVFRKEVLVTLLQESSEPDLGRHVLPGAVKRFHSRAFNFQGYWADVGTVQAYYEANLGLLAETPALDMYDPDWVIHTVPSERPGAEVGQTARVENSMISDGCQIHGSVIRSIISPGVFVADGAVVRDSIILGDAQIGPDAVIERCIIDENAQIGAGACVGDGDDNTPNHQAPDRLNTGLTLVGIRAIIPDQARIGRNVAIRPRTEKRAFPKTGNVDSGSTI